MQTNKLEECLNEQGAALGRYKSKQKCVFPLKSPLKFKSQACCSARFEAATADVSPFGDR